MSWSDAVLEVPKGQVAAADTTRTPILVADGVSKSYGHHVGLKSAAFTVSSGEFLALVGPSGSGKSTLLRLIGGFELPDTGRILIDGRDVTADPPAARPTSMVFQRLALFPHMTVAENISFPLRIRGNSLDTIARRLADIMRLMHLRTDYAGRYPSQLSGGEQQRVALARSMISSPRILLLDEPLSALDVKLRKELQAELRALHRHLGVTFIHVTHDLEEAMILADRICVMREGTIVQIGTPHEIYNRPSDAFVAGFVGETNLIPVELVERRDKTFAVCSSIFAGREVVLAADQVEPSIRCGQAILTLRPESIRPCEETPASVRISGCVDEIFRKGSITQYRLRSVPGDIPIVFEVQTGRGPSFIFGETLQLYFRPVDSYVVAREGI